MDLAIVHKLEWLIGNQSCKYLKNDLYSVQKMGFAADDKFVTSRKILKLIHRSFRFEDEDQFQLVDRNYLAALDYYSYKADDMIPCACIEDSDLRSILHRQLITSLAMKDDLEKRGVEPI